MMGLVGRALSAIISFLGFLNLLVTTNNFWGWLWNQLTLQAPSAARNLVAFFATIGGMWGLVQTLFAGGMVITGWGLKWVTAARKAGLPLALEPVGVLAYLLSWLYSLVNSGVYAITWTMEAFRRDIRKGEPIARVNAQQAVELFGRNLIDVTTFEKYLLDEGFDSDEANKLTDLYFNDADVGTILEQHHRLQSKPQDTHMLLVRKGFTQKAAEALLDNSYKILTIDQLLQAYLKGYIPDITELYDRAHLLGYQSAEVDILVAANGEPISIGQALDLWNKQEGAQLAIDLGVANEIEREWAKGKGEADVNRAVLEGPLNNYWFNAIKKLRYNMLGAPDYIRFAVRDVYDTAKRKLFTLDEDYPAIVGAKLKMLGYSPKDAEDAWAAHWELPSPTQAFEMLHRGVLPEGITIEDFLKSADYAPVWRKAMTDISYNPITRTDAKRMYKLRAGGGYDPSKIMTPAHIDALPDGDPFKQLVRNFLNNGYTITDAIDLATFTKEDINVENSNERHGISSGLKNAIVSMYKGRIISADDVRTYLSQLTYTDETIEQFIIEAEFFRLQDEKADVAAALKNAYVKALRSRADTVALLETAGWTGTPLDDLMGTWDLLRTATELQPHQETTRDLTKTELLNAYEDNIITDVEVVDGLIALGYDHNEATTLKAHSDLKRKKAENAMQQELVHQRYIGREITYDTASIELDKYNVPVTQKLILLKKWTVELEKRVPDFTLTQLEGMVRAKVMDESVARGFLRDQGYMDSQVEYLTSWWLGKKLLFETGKGKTLLRRTDVEGMYIDNRGKRAEAIDLFRQLGYSNNNINVILDSIDQNLNRTIGPKLT